MSFTVDVVIPTYNIPERFTDLLKMLHLQSHPVSKIIIMNTVSDLNSDPEFQDYPDVSVYPVKITEFDHGKTRNEGLKKSDADYVLFLTQDVEIPDAFLVENLLEGFLEDPDAVVVYGRQLARENAKETEKYSRAFNYPGTSRTKRKEDLPELGIKTFFCSDVCAMYDRKAFLELGGFIDKTIFNEDMIFAHKVITSGKAVVYRADARVIHSHDYSGMQQLHRNFDLGVSQADHPEVFSGISSSKEGKSLVKNTALHLLKMKKPLQIISLVYISGMKYLGFLLGKNYKKLPDGLVRKLSMNQNYWR